MYQIYARPCKSERAIMIMFSQSILAHVPLGTAERLLNPNFKFGVSFIYGDSDWIRKIDEDAPDLIVSRKKHLKGKIHTLPDSGHLLHFDNPIGLARIIVNDVLGSVNGKELEVGPDLTRLYKNI